MQDEPHILDAALREIIGGQTPPNLIAATLARVGATHGSPAPDKPAAGTDKPPIPLRRPWLRWSLAAAACVAVGALVFWQAAVIPDYGHSATQTHDLAKMAPAKKPKKKVRVSRGGFQTVTIDYDKIYPPDEYEIEWYDEPVSFPAQTKTIDITGGRDGVPDWDKPEPYPEQYKNHGTNAFIDTEDEAKSTFAIDVDTGSYTKARGFLNSGKLPPADAIRAEEFVNFFKYDYPQPMGDAQFSITMDGAPSRYGANLRNCYLIRVGLKAREILAADRKPANLTFVIDVSGSMEGETRLGLVKQSLKLLLSELRDSDQVGIAIFGDKGEEFMPHRYAKDREAILQSIESLHTDGSTNLEEGLKVGYAMAAKAFSANAINRVIFCSDGGANVGATGSKEVLEGIAEQRRKGITLSSIGFGMGGYNDDLMEQLGDKGDGHYAFVDTLDEAKRVFVENLNGTLQVVARDVKMQLEFNPAVVKSWRLIGYENRDVANKDFRNDSVDGGEVGAGHSVTALYEVKLAEVGMGQVAKATVRYKHDERDEFLEINREIYAPELALYWAEAKPDFRLAANAAEFAEILRESFWAKEASLDAVIEDLETLNLRDASFEELKALVKKSKELKK
jgi:Ca-activated chloride channel family protein